MPILACGVNHKSAPIEVREHWSFVPEVVNEVLQEAANIADVREVAILSTCNRTEFYCEADTLQPLLHWLQQQRLCSQVNLTPYLYCYDDERAAIKHILRVATGLDSMVLGEQQIFGQMKDAFALADTAGTLGPQLQRLSHYLSAVTKEIRTNTGIGANPVSMAYVAANLAKKLFTNVANKTVMLIGAGETAELTLRYLREHQVNSIIIVNRTYNKAQALAEKYQGKAATFSEMANLLTQTDIVISATRSAIPILGKGTVERVLKQRNQRPIFMIDLAVPRDIEPEVNELGNIYLYCIDDLQHIITQNLKHRQDAALEAERLIELQVDHYMQWLRSLDAVETIRLFRGKIELVRDQEIKNAHMLLQQGAAPEAVICTLARNLANKIMHVPTVRLRQAGYDQDLELLALTRNLFEIEV